MIASMEPCTSPLDEQREFLEAGVLQLAHHLVRSEPLTVWRQPPVAGQTLAIFGNLASTVLVFDDGELVTGSRRAGAVEHSDRHGRTRFLDMVALVGDERAANAAPLIAGNDLRLQRALLTRTVATAPRPRSSWASMTIPSAVRRVGLEVEDFGLQEDGGFEQLVEVGLVLRRHFDVEQFPPPSDST